MSHVLIALLKDNTPPIYLNVFAGLFLASFLSFWFGWAWNMIHRPPPRRFHSIGLQDEDNTKS